MVSSRWFSELDFVSDSHRNWNCNKLGLSRCSIEFVLGLDFDTYHRESPNVRGADRPLTGLLCWVSLCPTKASRLLASGQIYPVRISLLALENINDSGLVGITLATGHYSRNKATLEIYYPLYRGSLQARITGF
jgi:hypothetical protein